MPIGTTLPSRPNHFGSTVRNDPGVKAIEEHLKDAVDGDETGNVVGVAFGQFVPHQHHCDAAGDADQDQAAHVGRFTAQKDDCEQEHQHGADEPVLHQREPEDALVAKDLAQLLVADLRQRRKHHDDEADGDRDVRRAGLKAVDEAGRGRNEVTDRDADRHGEEDPERQEAIKKRELLAGGGSADLPLREGSGGHQQTSQDDSGIGDGSGSAIEQGVLRGRAAGLREPRAVRLHGLFFLEPAQRLPQDLRSPDVRRHHDPVVHPLSLAPRRDDARAAKVGEVPGDLRLRPAKNLHEVADANLLIAHEVQEPEPRVVSERLKEPLDVERLFSPCLMYTP